MKKYTLKTWIAGMLMTSAICNPIWAGDITQYVNPLFGTTTLWDKKDLGYEMSDNPIYRTVLTEQGRRPAQGKTRASFFSCSYPSQRVARFISFRI